MPIWPREASSVSAYSTEQAPMTIVVNPKSLPRRRSSGANPHIPGFHRPQV